MRLKPIIRGILSYIPGFTYILKKRTGGTISARYCYSVWLRHLVQLKKNGLENHPKIIAELGPGDSLGIGLTALLTGANTYYGFDVITYSDIERNLNIFKELVNLLRAKSPIPDQIEFPQVKPELADYSFPEHILNDENLQVLLDPKRLDNIENAIRDMNSNSPESPIKISYVVPWTDIKMINQDSIDLIFSQAVMEHVLELQDAYSIMCDWLRPGAYISHEIDYRAHELDNRWYGHWTYSDFIWEIMMNGRLYEISRLPHSAHISMIKKAGFEVISETKDYDKAEFKRASLNPKFRNFEKEDYVIPSAHIIACKK